MNSSPNQLFVQHAVKASFIDFVDQKVILFLRDGVSYIGTLRTFDQFQNVVLQVCCLFVCLSVCRGHTFEFTFEFREQQKEK